MFVVTVYIQENVFYATVFRIFLSNCTILHAAIPDIVGKKKIIVDSSSDYFVVKTGKYGKHLHIVLERILT